MTTDPSIVLNTFAANLDPDKLAELEEKFGYKFQPSASQPNDEPMARRTAKGKSLPKAPATSVPGTTSAKRTRPNNPARDKAGYRQTSRYKAQKLSARSLETKQAAPNDERLQKPSAEEVRDRLLNPNNRHHTTNPVITQTGTLK